MDRDRLVHERREQKIKDFLSNLKRTGIRAMVPTVNELEELCGLVTGGGYRLFGYELDAIREYDRRLNAKRTHIVETSPRLVMVDVTSYIDCPVKDPIQPAPQPRTPAPNNAPKSPGMAS